MLVATATVSALAAAGLVGLRPPVLRVALDPSSEPLVPRGDPAETAYRQSVLDFGDDELYVVALETLDVFTRENLLAIRRLSRAIVELPGVRRVESLLNAYSFRNDPATDTLIIRPLVERIPETRAGLEELRRRALADPLWAKTLISGDGRATALNVRFEAWTDLARIEAGLDASIRRAVEAESSAGRHFYVAGRHHVVDRAYRVMLRDLLTLMPLAVALMAALLFAVSGSVRGVVIPLGTVLTATLWTFGAVAWLDIALNVVTVVLGPILIAVGSVYGVHVLAHYEAAAERAPDRASAARRLIETTRQPVLISGVSTVIGFGALLATDVPAARELGAFAVVGVASVTLLSLTALPALVAFLPLRSNGTGLAAWIGARLGRALAGVGDFATRRSGGVIAFWLVLGAASLALLPRIEVDTDYLSFFSADTPLRRDFAAVNRLLAGAVPIYIVLRGEGDGAFREPANLRTLERAQARADAVPGVTASLSAADLVRVVNGALWGPADERIPDSRGEIADLLLLVPRSVLRPLSTVDQSRVNLLVRTGELGSASVRTLVERLESALAEAGLGDLRASVSGRTVLVNRSADGLATSQLRTVGGAAAAIFVLVALSFRSLRLAAVALVPNLVPVLIFYGLLGAGVAPLSLPTSLIGSVALGIAIDDTMHFLVRYRRARRAGGDPAAAARECVREVGRPIAITSVMLVLGFAVVGLSGFETLSEFGMLIGLTMGVCLATDLVLLPAILVRARL